MNQDEWDDLNYPVMLQKDGPDWYAWIPMLGCGLFMEDGETQDEALNKLENHRREQYQVVVASGVKIPIPPDINEAMHQPASWLLFRKDGTVERGTYTDEELQRNPDLAHPFLRTGK